MAARRRSTCSPLVASSQLITSFKLAGAMSEDQDASIRPLAQRRPQWGNSGRRRLAGQRRECAVTGRRLGDDCTTFLDLNPDYSLKRAHSQCGLEGYEGLSLRTALP